jgi:hypothetical protein
MNTLLHAYRYATAVVLALLVIMPASAQSVSKLQTADLVTEQRPARSASFELAAPVVVDPAIVPRADPIVDILDQIKDLEKIPAKPLALSKVEWNEYGNRLEAALATDHLALNHAALRLIIAYGDNFELNQDAVFNVMRIYRDDDSERARRMAVVALAEMNSDWAIKFLERSSRFEKSNTVKQTILAVLASRANRDIAL